MKEDVFYCEKCGETHYLKSTKEHEAICPKCAISMEFCESINYNNNANYDNSKKNTKKQEIEANIEDQKLYLLTDIHRMLKFFYMLSIIEIVAGILLIIYFYSKLI